MPTTVDNFIGLRFLCLSFYIEPFSNQFLWPWELPQKKHKVSKNWSLRGENIQITISINHKLWNRNKKTLLFLEFPSLIVSLFPHAALLYIFPSLQIHNFSTSTQKKNHKIQDDEPQLCNSSPSTKLYQSSLLSIQLVPKCQILKRASLISLVKPRKLVHPTMQD